MRNHIAAALALSGTAVFACSTASATNFSYFGDVARGASLTGAIIKVHSRRETHDMLHGFGYDHVVYRSRYYDEHDKPVYRFRACTGRRAYMVDMNWYGNIIDRHRTGRCHSYVW